MTTKIKPIDAITLKYLRAQTSLNLMIKLAKELQERNEILLETIKNMRNYKDKDLMEKHGWQEL